MEHKQQVPIVLLPGWGADSRIWLELTELLGKGEPLHFLDLPFNDARALGSVESEVALLAEKMPNNSKVIAWSLGGMFAVQIAKQYPHKISQLCLLATNATFVERSDWREAMPLTTFSTFCESFDSDAMKTIARFNTLQIQGVQDRRSVLKKITSRGAINEQNAENARKLLRYLSEFDNTDDLFGLSQPLLAIFGDEDALVPVATAERVRAGFSVHGQKKRSVEIIKHCGHIPHLSHTAHVAKLINIFFQSDKGDVSLDKYYKDKRRIEESFSKASRTYDQFAVLQRKVAEQLCKWAPSLGGRVLDIGCGTGYCLLNFAKRSNVSSLVGLDLAYPMLAETRKKSVKAHSNIQFSQADMENLPFPHGAFDTVVSSLALQWAGDIRQWFKESARVLSNRGNLLVASLGAKTLGELTAAWTEADPTYVHVNQFEDAGSVLDIADAQGFDLLVAATDYQIFEYASVKALMEALKGIGAHNVNSGGNPGLTGRATFKRLAAAYEKKRNERHMLPVTYEVHYWLFVKRVNRP